MANELQISGAGAGKTFAARIRRTSDLQVRITGTGLYEAWNDANIATYRIALTDAGGGCYRGDFPAIAAGIYLVEYEDTVSGPSDMPTTELFIWDGTQRLRPLTPAQYVAPVIEGTVSSVSPTTTNFTATGTNLSSSDSLYSDQRMYVHFTSGVNKGVRKLITGYVGSTKQITTKAFPSAPAQNDTFWVVS